MWMALAGAALSGISAYSGASVAKAQTNANNRVSAATTKASNQVRGAGNAFSAAKGELARYMQRLQNNQALEAGGEALEANLINARRQDDAMAEASFEDQLRNAEQLGQQAAAAAFAGVGGEVADTISLSTRLMQQRASAQALKSRELTQYDATRRAGVIAQQTVRSLDQSLILDSLDYSINVAQKGASQSVWGSTVAAVGGSLLSNAGSFANAKAAPKSEWGTGSAFGNQDYGQFL